MSINVDNIIVCILNQQAPKTTRSHPSFYVIQHHVHESGNFFVSMFHWESAIRPSFCIDAECGAHAVRDRCGEGEESGSRVVCFVTANSDR